MRTVLKEDGLAVIEVPYLADLVEQCEFDTIYHEHFQYWTVLAAQGAMRVGGLRIVDVELLETHGGSIRLWAAAEDAGITPSPRVAEVIETECAAGLDTVEGYMGLARETSRVRDDLVAYLIEARRSGRRVAG